MISQCTKFEVSRFTHYDAMNGGAKCRKWGSLGQFGVTQGHGQCHHSIERIRLPIRLYRNYVSIFYRFRDIAGYLSKVADFDRPTPPAFSTLVGGDPGRISRRSLASENWTPWAIVWCYLCDPTFSRFSRTPTCDGRTDRRTQGHE